MNIYRDDGVSIQWIRLADSPSPGGRTRFRKQLHVIIRIIRCLCRMLSIQEPPSLSTSDLLLARRSTKHQHGDLKPLIIIDHHSEQSHARSSNSCLAIGSEVQAKVFFNIEVLRDGIDGLPRTDVLLSFDELISLPLAKGKVEITVSTWSHSIQFQRETELGISAIAAYQ